MYVLSFDIELAIVLFQWMDTLAAVSPPYFISSVDCDCFKQNLHFCHSIAGLSMNFHFLFAALIFYSLQIYLHFSFSFLVMISIVVLEEAF